MTWLAWRQSRTQALAALGVLVVFAAVVVPIGLHLRTVYGSLGGAHCDLRCGFLVMTDHVPAKVLGPVLLGFPAALGMFWGAPLVAREFETGTHRLVWTQSITRRRWLLVTVAVVGATALAVAGLASWLVSWWYAPLDAALKNRLALSVFPMRGIVVVGYAGFAFALGVAIGALTRRTLPAMALTLVGYAAALGASTFWLIKYLPFTTQMAVPPMLGTNLQFAPAVSPSDTVSPQRVTIPNGLVLSSRLVDRAGHAIGPARLHALVVRACPSLVPPQDVPADVPKIMRKSSAAHYNDCAHQLSRHLRILVTGQPPGHYWLLQALLTAIYLAAAAALLALTLSRVDPHPPRGRAHDRPRRRATAQVVQNSRA